MAGSGLGYRVVVCADFDFEEAHGMLAGAVSDRGDAEELVGAGGGTAAAALLLHKPLPE